MIPKVAATGDDDHRRSSDHPGDHLSIFWLYFGQMAELQSRTLLEPVRHGPHPLTENL